MIGQLAGGASFDKAFQAGLKAGATSALMAGVAAGVSSMVNGSAASSTANTTTSIDSGSQNLQLGNSGATTTAASVNKLDTLMSANYWQQTGLNALAKGALTKAQGGKFEDGLIGSVVGSLAASGAGIVGGLTQDNTLANIVSHAVLGCAVAAASNQDCGSGALGGAASASLARVIDGALGNENLSNGDPNDPNRKAIIAAGAVTGSMVIAAATGKDVLTTGNAAANEVTNNYLDHRRPSMMRLSEKEQYENAVAACGGGSGDPAACATQRELAAVSTRRDAELRGACSGGTPDLCNTIAKEAMAMGNIVQGSNGQFVYANSPESGPIRFLNAATIGTPTRPDNFQDQVGKSTSEALLLEGQNQLLGGLLAAAAKGTSATQTALKEYFLRSGVTVSDEAATRIALNFGRDGDRFTIVAEQMAAAKNAKWVTTEGKTWWPPGNGGVPGTEFQTTLPVGTQLDRYGGTSQSSSFLAPRGTPVEQRALSPTTSLAVRDEYVVVRPFQVEQSNVMPWFGQNGMGRQFDTKGGVGLPIEKLVEQGYLRKVTP